MKANSALFFALCLTEGLRTPEAEHKFHPTRKWRFDYAWTPHKVALEVEGGIFSGGRHTRGSGFVKDMEKYNAAGALGWVVLRCTPKTLCTMETVKMIQATINNKQEDSKCK